MRYRGLWSVMSLLSAAILVNICAPSGWAAKPLQDDFAKLDRAYVPALALTKMGTREASEQAMKRLKREWYAFDAKFRGAVPEDNLWQMDCGRVSKAIATAEKQLDSGQQLEAHESLEAIREILMEARGRSGLNYYLDYLTRFHTTMEEIVLAVKVEQPGDLQPEAIERIRRLAREASQQWAQVKSAPFRKERFGFDEKKTAQREQLLKAETRALAELEEALASHSKARIVAKGRAIKPLFAKSFMLFGDFPPPSGK